jgi:hypothetical protein
MATGGRAVGQVRAEVKATGLAAVFGVQDVQVAVPVPPLTADRVADSVSEGIAITTATAVGTAPTPVTSRALFDQRPGQVVNTSDPLDTVRDIFSRWHRLLSSTREGLEKAKRKQLLRPARRKSS